MVEFGRLFAVVQLWRSDGGGGGGSGGGGGGGGGGSGGGALTRQHATVLQLVEHWFGLSCPHQYHHRQCVSEVAAEVEAEAVEAVVVL